MATRGGARHAWASEASVWCVAVWCSRHRPRPRIRGVTSELQQTSAPVVLSKPQAGSTYGFGNVPDTKQDSNGSKPDAEAG